MTTELVVTVGIIMKRFFYSNGRFTTYPLCVTLFIITLLLMYLMNFIKYSTCDWQAPYCCEVIHGVGIVLPPLSYLTHHAEVGQ